MTDKTSVKLKTARLTERSTYLQVFSGGYPNQFAQTILCILQNARDAFLERGVKDGRVVIVSLVADDSVVVTIADNAGGIPEDIQPRIFDAYFSTKGEAGTGIGLFMTKTIIEAMGGSISVRNAGNGAEFNIKIPVKATIR